MKLTTKVLSENPNQKSVRVSIITVCYNAEKTIRETIESVLNQTYTDFEYIIQDGLSQDHTMDIVREYAPKFAQRGITYCYQSSKDTGIYNAMNKATEKARGEWCIYMNADDSFYSNSVLKEVFGTETYKGYDAVYGAYCRHDEKNSYVFQSEKIETLPKKMPFVHQAIFIRTEVMKQYGYDEQYRLCADYDSCFKMYADGKRFQKIPTVIANYSIRGISGTENIKALDETVLIREKHAEQFPISRYQKSKWAYLKCMMYLKNCMPDFLIRYLRCVKVFFRVKLLHKTTN